MRVADLEGNCINKSCYFLHISEYHISGLGEREGGWGLTEQEDTNIIFSCYAYSLELDCCKFLQSNFVCHFLAIHVNKSIWIVP